MRSGLRESTCRRQQQLAGQAAGEGGAPQPRLSAGVCRRRGGAATGGRSSRRLQGLHAHRHPGGGSGGVRQLGPLAGAHLLGLEKNTRLAISPMVCFPLSAGKWLYDRHSLSRGVAWGWQAGLGRRAQELASLLRGFPWPHPPWLAEIVLHAGTLGCASRLAY